jgi:uncharacterized membrane protein
MKNGKLVGAAVVAAAAALFAAGGVSLAADSGDTVKVKCYGANACKGQAECKTSMNSCKGHNECKGKGFVSMGEKACLEHFGRSWSSRLGDGAAAASEAILPARCRPTGRRAGASRLLNGGNGATTVGIDDNARILAPVGLGPRGSLPLLKDLRAVACGHGPRRGSDPECREQDQEDRGFHVRVPVVLEQVEKSSRVGERMPNTRALWLRELTQTSRTAQACIKTGSLYFLECCYRSRDVTRAKENGWVGSLDPNPSEGGGAVVWGALEQRAARIAWSVSCVKRQSMVFSLASACHEMITAG